MDVAAFCRRSGLLLCLLFFITLSSPLYPATQGKPGNTSSGSFRITLVVHPKLSTYIESSTNPSSEIAESLTINQPTRFCVSGKGISQYSLSVDDLPERTDQELVFIQSSGRESSLGSDIQEKFRTHDNCKTSPGRLIIKANQQEKSLNLPPAIDLVVQAE